MKSACAIGVFAAVTAFTGGVARAAPKPDPYATITSRLVRWRQGEEEALPQFTTRGL